MAVSVVMVIDAVIAKTVAVALLCITIMARNHNILPLHFLSRVLFSVKFNITFIHGECRRGRGCRFAARLGQWWPWLHVGVESVFILAVVAPPLG